MNTYKITFHNSETGDQGYEHFTAANEKDAKYALKSVEEKLKSTVA